MGAPLRPAPAPTWPRHAAAHRGRTHPPAGPRGQGSSSLRLGRLGLASAAAVQRRVQQCAGPGPSRQGRARRPTLGGGACRYRTALHAPCARPDTSGTAGTPDPIDAPPRPAPCRKSSCAVKPRCSCQAGEPRRHQAARHSQARSERPEKGTGKGRQFANPSRTRGPQRRRDSHSYSTPDPHTLQYPHKREALQVVPRPAVRDCEHA